MAPTDIARYSELGSEVARRRTFAIISHPDAGKTTLTEKLLLYSGLIRTAGVVGSRKTRQTAASDWMAMEQERGISISASAMQFAYKGTVINLLDTPGHQDFSEDTYRTLSAADSAVMVIDAGKGVESQTRKLFEVCRLRRIPVVTLMNKLDLHGRPPLDLMAEVEEVLGIQASPLNWPLGMGGEFKGIVDRQTMRLLRFTKTASGGTKKATQTSVPLDDKGLRDEVPGDLWDRLQQELELLDVAGNTFSRDRFRQGELTPVFFASALTNFGIEPFFDALVELAPAPRARPAKGEDGADVMVDPVETPFSAFVFKLQANMNPRHRDSTAFLRICSGRFERDMVVRHDRTGKTIRLARSHGLIGQDRTTVDLAYPGDIVGVSNPGLFAIGDTLSVSTGLRFGPLPHFQPEHVARIRPLETGKRKAFDKGITQMTEDGTVHILQDLAGAEWFIAAVGRLQFEVLQYRLRAEYGVETTLEPLPYSCSAWLVGDHRTFYCPGDAILVKDRFDRVVALFTSPWQKGYAQERNPEHRLVDIADEAEDLSIAPS